MVLAYIAYYIKLKPCIILSKIYLQILRIIVYSFFLIDILAALLIWVNVHFIYKVYKSLKIGYSMILMLLSILHMLFFVIATQRRYCCHFIVLLICLLVVYLDSLDGCIYTIVLHLGIKRCPAYWVIVTLYSSQLGIYNRMMVLAIIILVRPVIDLFAYYFTQLEHILIYIIVASKVNHPYNIFNAFSQVFKVIYSVKTRASMGREFSIVYFMITRRCRHYFGSKLMKL